MAVLVIITYVLTFVSDFGEGKRNPFSLTQKQRSLHVQSGTAAVVTLLQLRIES